MQLHMLLVFALVRLTTQTIDLAHSALERSIDIVPTDTEKLQLILINAANAFASFAPAQGLQPPLVSSVPSLWQIINSNSPSLTVISNQVSTTTELPTVTEASESIPITTPTFRLPVSTRPPGVPHHRTADDSLQSELIDKIYKFMNAHTSFELRYTNRFKSDAPELIANQENSSPPLFHSSDASSRAAASETSESAEESDIVFSLPDLPAKPFSSVISDETLPMN